MREGELVRAANALSGRWARATLTGDSAVLAGVGVWPLLALLAASAAGKAREELVAAAGVPAARGMDAAGALLGMLRGSRGVNAALGVWTAEEIQVREAWRASVPDGAWEKLDADDPERGDAWASEQTKGAIEKFPFKVNAGALLVLASALLVETRWKQGFEVESYGRGSGPWAGEQNLAWLGRATGEMDSLKLAEATHAGALSLAEVVGEDDISVFLVAGEKTAKPGEVVNAAIEALGQPASLRGGGSLKPGENGPGVSVRMVAGTGPARLSLTTVAFDIESSHDLLENKELLGLKEASDDEEGHFPQISQTPLYVSQAKQSANAAFTAEGFRAAAVTAVEMAMAMAMPARPSGEHLEVSVRFDRPFGFVGVQRSSGLVLVAGWVGSGAKLAARGKPYTLEQAMARAQA